MYFRIVHVTPQEGLPPGTYCEQTVEVAIGPDPKFDGSSASTLTRRIPAERVVHGLAPSRCRPKAKRRVAKPRAPRTPPIVATLRKAIEWRRQLDAGEVPNQAAIARREGLSRARVTQIMMLLRLSAEIQRFILSLPQNGQPVSISEHTLRPIAMIEDWEEQASLFQRKRPPAPWLTGLVV